MWQFIGGVVVGFILGGAAGAGVMYLWKIKGKILVKAKDLIEQGKVAADAGVAKIGDVIK